MLGFTPISSAPFSSIDLVGDEVSIDVTGLVCTAILAEVTIGIAIHPTGLQLQSTLNSVNVELVTRSNVVGVYAVSSLGTTTLSAGANINPNGQSLVGGLGNIPWWGDIPDSENVVWIPVSDTQTDSWIPIDTTPVSTWKKIVT